MKITKGPDTAICLVSKIGQEPLRSHISIGAHFNLSRQLRELRQWVREVVDHASIVFALELIGQPIATNHGARTLIP